MPDAAIYNDLGELKTLKREARGLCGIALDVVICNDVYGLEGFYDPREEYCSGTVRILMADGKVCDKTKKCKRASF